VDGGRISDTGWRQLDPRKIDLDREVGWVVTAILSVAWLVGLGVLSLSDNAPGWSWWGAALLWAPLTVAVAVLSYRWPPIEYRRTRYRIDEELIEIERGVVFRMSIAVPRSRVQHLDVSQGPMMRRHGLAQLSIYTAGTEYSLVTLPGLAHDVAQSLRDRLLPRGTGVDGV
jgi:hypothetical protein